MDDFPFDIMDVASLLELRVRRRSANYVYTDCPFCGDKRGKFNVNFVKNVFRCNYCGEYGGMLAMYAKAHGINNSEAYREICGALQTGNRPSGYEVKRIQKQPLIQNSELAGIEEIHQTLSMLLGMLTLSDYHRTKLRSRGLTDDQIDRLGYKSTPSFFACKPYTERLIKQGCTIQGVPGFFLDKDGKWTVAFYTVTAGILIPVKGIDGLIRGAQIRLDVPMKDENDDPDKEGTKYLWLSSSNKHMGVTSGSPVHFVGDPFARTVYVTEGSLKADVAHCLMNRSFAAVAGANNLGQLDLVFSALAYNGTELIIEAHDMDKYRNEMIDKGAAKIYVMAQKYQMESRRLTWNPNYKGIDDWQLAMRQKSMKKEGCKMKFRELFNAGLIGFDTVDNFIDEWQKNAGEDQGLREYLGLTEDEYAAIDCGDELRAMLLSRQKKQRFRIYQLNFGNGVKIIPFAFLGIKALRKSGFEKPPAAEYRMETDSEVSCSIALPDKDILSLIRYIYSEDKPDDYHGRVVSPSDVIELYDDEKRQFFYCDPNDFTEVEFSASMALPSIAQ